MPAEVQNIATQEEFRPQPETKDKGAKRILNTAFGVTVGAVFQPLQVSKVLIQLGYEPFALQRGRAWGIYGNEKRYLPNGFAYAKNLYVQRGLSAIYRGVSASICGNFLGVMATFAAEEHLAKYYGLADVDDKIAKPNNDPSYEARRVLKRIARGSLSKVAGIIVARPFQVVMIRMIAQHIGGEQMYTGVLSGLSTIYKEEGFPGLFSGLVPQIACELCIYWTVTSISYVFEYLWKTYVEREDKGDDELDEDRLDATSPPKTLKTMVALAVPFVVNGIFYPLQLVSTIMAVNGSSLLAGHAPFIPMYPTWQDCYYDFKDKEQLKRGSKMFFRFYEKPITYRNGAIFAIPNVKI